MKLKKILLISALLLSVSLVSAKSISPAQAEKAARNYIVAMYNRSSDCQMTLAHTAIAANGITSYYIFNIDNNAFVIATADDRCVPVIAYSPNGIYNAADVPPAVQMWLDWMRQDISVIIEKDLWHMNYWDADVATEEWNALLNDDLKYYEPFKTKAYTDSLLTTKWGQGQGYNDFCPQYNGTSSAGSESSGGRAVVGCVSTALSQIIRYHEYPSRGFGFSKYKDASYDTLKVCYDSFTYNYNMMPNTVTTTTRTEISRLCYHVGVLSEMHYAGRNYTGGSGAHLYVAANGLVHMGYFRAKYKAIGQDSNTSAGWDKWKSWVRREITARRPILYAGYDAAYSMGHAYVVDGFKMKSNGLAFHINWGWNGSYNGNYWYMNGVNPPLGGYGYRQECVYNIEPSYLTNTINGPGRYYISSSATASNSNNGSSWAKANPNLSDAIQACGMYDSGEILVKKGFYYGDTNTWLGVTSAFITSKNQSTHRGNGVNVYGGFAGNESEIEDRNPEQNGTYLDGSSKLRVLYASAHTSPITFDGFTIRNGKITSGNGAGAYLKANATLSNSTICNSTSGSSNGGGAYIEDGKLLNVKVNCVTGACAVYAKNGRIENCIIANNDGKGVQFTSGGNIIGSNIVGNSGTGVTMVTNATMRNCIVWNNATQTSGSGTITYCAVMGNAPSGDGNVALASGNMDATGPHFVQPITAQGIDYSDANWQLADAQSPCYNAGDPSTSDLAATDYAGNDRVRHGRVDIGCFEYRNLGISKPTANSVEIYPNPASDMVHFDGATTDIAIYDIAGRMVLNVKATEGNATANLSNLPAGVYFARTGNAIAKIVKR